MVGRIPRLWRVLNAAWLPPLLCAALVVPATWWLARIEYFQTHDGDLHLWRVWEFWQVWRSGEAPLRWAPDLNYGFGSPLFVYYNPLPYLLGGVAQAWGLGAADAAKLIYGLALALGALGMYLLASEWYSRAPSRRWAGLLAATAYLYAPYVLADVSIRGAMAEALALGIVPWLLWAELRCLRRPDLPAHLALALSVAALVLAHNLTAVMFAPVALGLAVCWLVGHGPNPPTPVSASGEGGETLTPPSAPLSRSAGEGLGVRASSARVRAALKRLFPGVALGLALAAFYWLPMAGQLGYVQIERDRGVEGAPTFADHLVPLDELVLLRPVHDYREDYRPDETSQRPTLPHLGLVQAAVLVAALGLRARRGRWRRPEEALLVVGVALAVCVTSLLSRVAWESLPLLAFFQFPWRFFGAVAVLGGLAAGGLATARRGGAAVAVVLGIGLVTAGAWVFVTPIEWRADWDTPSNLREFERQTKQIGLSSWDEFLPTWVRRTRRNLFQPPEAATASAAPLRVELLDAPATDWQLDVAAAEAQPLAFDVFYFPTWRATVDGQPRATRPLGDVGLLAVDVPAGRHRLRVYQEAPALERIGVGVSTAACVAVGGLLVALWLRSDLQRRLGLLLAAAVVLGAASPFVVAALRPTPSRYVPVPPDLAPPGPAHLLGVRLDQARLASTGWVDLALPVLVSGAPPAEEPLVRARLTDAGGRVVAETAHRLGQGLRPPTIWQPNLVLTDRFEWWLPAGAGGGRHTLHVGFGDGPLRPVGSFDLARSGARESFASLPPSDAARRPARWGEDLVLDDAELEVESPAGAGRAAAFGPGASLRGTLAWRRLPNRTAAYEVVVRLVYAPTTVLREIGAPLTFSPGELRQLQVVRFQLPVDLLPGRYRIELLVRDAAGEALEVRRDRASLGREARSPRHAMVVRADDYLPAGDRLPDGATALDLDLEDGIRALGYERRVVGDAVDVVVYWQARDVPKKSYSSYIHLLDRDGQPVGQLDGVPYGGELPTNAWRVGRVVPFAARFRLPDGRGPLRLRAGMYELPDLKPLAAADGRPDISLGLVERGEPARGPAVPFEGGLRLVGHRVEREAGQGVVTLYWQASRPVSGAYSVFVHVVDASGRLVAQGDGPPELGERTTADWPRGEVVVDPHRFALPAGGPFRIRVGLYRLADGRRLPLEGGGDAADLGLLE